MRKYKNFSAILEFKRLETSPDISFADVWNPAATEMRELAELYVTYPAVLKKNKLPFQQLVFKWRYITNVLYESKVKYNNTISLR